MDFDYIVVGGGSAGCAIAARLSERPELRVLLIEAGPEDRNPLIHMPAGFFRMFRRPANPFAFNYSTAPNPNVAGRPMPLRQARVLGGGSSINAMVCTRGSAADYDRWADQEGCPGWSYDDVLPLYRKLEDNEVFAGEHHGLGGPIGVSNPISPNALSKVFLQACQQAGIPYNPDFNGLSQAGCGLYQMTQRAGRRSSSAAGYLRDARGRRNLRIVTNALVEQLVIKNGRAVAVRYRSGGELRIVHAGSEIVVSAGAIGSPKLLLLSGVGPADHLRAVGVEVVHDLPGVGENLQDHLNVDLVSELSGPFSLERYAEPAMMLWAGAEYLLFGKGPVTSNIAEAGGFWYADRNAGSPDLQFHFMLGANLQAGMPPMAGKWGCTLDSYFTRPRSRGVIRLRSANPAAAPDVDPNYLSDPHDVEMSITGVEVSREIMAQPAWARYVKGEHYPGKAGRSRKEIEAFVRRFGRTAHHPAGACKMGLDAFSVVDPQLRVRGIDGLRVADSSIMPSLVSSNTNLPCMMIGEKAAAFILGDA